MRIGLITTDTPHHRYIAARISSFFPLSAIFSELTSVKPKFEAGHAFEAERDRFERASLLSGKEVPLESFAPVESFDNLNSRDALEAFCRAQLDVMIVAGARKLSPEALKAMAKLSLNLHGGDPEHFRGLDSHFWAIYHGEFNQLVSTVHLLSPELDAGDIVRKVRVPVRKGMRIEELRGSNTRAVTDACIAALFELKQFGKVQSAPQISAGRYYSFMPSHLKSICIDKFHRYTNSL